MAKVTSSPVLQTTGGKLRGVCCDGIYQFKNILYATAERFEPPRPAAWEGLRDCLSYGFAPPLLNRNDIGNDFYVPHYYWPTDEKECLNLNVWTPTLEKDAKKPVIVGLYGGSFETGFCAEMLAYDGTNLCRDGDVVYVTLNMRINMLGFFDLSSFPDGYENSGNLGFEDVLCGLHWVRDNITQFGGDPNNVTIFGSQGGGLRIRYLLQCPAFKGLFRNAFNASGVVDHGRPFPPEAHRQVALSMLENAGFPGNSIQPLKEMPWEQLTQLYKNTLKKENIRFRWRPVLNAWSYGRVEDEGVCPEMTDVTLVVGHTYSENSFRPEQHPDGRISMEDFDTEAQNRFGEDKNQILSLFEELYPEMDIRDSLYMGADHRVSVDEYAQLQVKVGATVYSYVFAPELALWGGIPAYHCCDVPYMLRNLDMVPAVWMEEHTERLMEQYSGMLIALAKTGNPNHAGMPEWKPYSAEEKHTMWFGKETKLCNKNDRPLAELLDKHRVKNHKK